MRAGPAVAVAALLVLAGCGGVSVGAGTPTLTPAALPPPPSATGTSPPTLAPGLATGGVTDAWALSSAHRSTIANTSHTRRVVETTRDVNGTLPGRTSLLWRSRTTARVAAGGEPFYRVTNVSGVPDATWPFVGAERVELYGDDDRRYVAVFEANDTRFLAFDGTDANRRTLFALFAAVETRTVGRVARNGTTHYRVESVRLRNEGAFRGAMNVPPGRTVRNVSVRALVSERGLVRAYAVAYTAERDGQVVRITRRVSYGALGSTAVERPAWVDEAVDATRDPGDDG